MAEAPQEVVIMRCGSHGHADHGQKSFEDVQHVSCPFDRVSSTAVGLSRIKSLSDELTNTIRTSWSNSISGSMEGTANTPSASMQRLRAIETIHVAHKSTSKH